MFLIRSFLIAKSRFYYGWVIVFASGCAMFARNASGSLTLSVFLYPMSRDLGWSRTLIAGGSSVGGIISILGSPISGWAVDHIGSKWVLVIGVLTLGISTFCLGIITNIQSFYLFYGLGRFLFIGPIPIAASVVVSRWFVTVRGRAMGVLFLCQSAGMALIPYLAALTIQGVGWRSTWIFLGIGVWAVALLPVLLCIVQTPEHVGLHPDPSGSTVESDTSKTVFSADGDFTLKQAMGTKALWICAVTTGLMFLIQSGTNVHQVAYFIDKDISASWAALAVSVSGVTAGLSSVLWGWLIDRFSQRWIFCSVALIMAGSVGVFPLISGPLGALGVSALFGISVGGILVIPPVVYAHYYGRQSLGVIRGVTEPCVAIGQAAGPVLSGAVYDVTGSYGWAFQGFALLALLSAIAILCAGRPRLNG